MRQAARDKAIDVFGAKAVHEWERAQKLGDALRAVRLCAERIVDAADGYVDGAPDCSETSSLANQADYEAQSILDLLDRLEGLV